LKNLDECKDLSYLRNNKETVKIPFSEAK
jgi:hypothetical protein